MRERKRYKHNTKENHQTTREETKRTQNYKINLKKQATKKCYHKSYQNSNHIPINTHLKCQWNPNVPTKRCKVVDWIKKQDPSIYCLQETNFKAKDIKTERRGWKKISKQMKEKRNLEKQYSYYTKIGFDKGVNIRRHNTC